MLSVSSNIEKDALCALLVPGASIIFEDTQCTLELREGKLLGDSPYGYVDFLAKDEPSALTPLMLWIKSWVSFSPSVCE